MIINTELLKPRNVLTILIMALLALWLAKKFLPHPATQPGGRQPVQTEGTVAPAGVSTQLDTSFTNDH